MENLNLQKLPEVPDKKKGWRMRKEKGNLLTKGNRLSFSFRQWPAIWQHRCRRVSGRHAYVFGLGVG